MCNTTLSYTLDLSNPEESQFEGTEPSNRKYISLKCSHGVDDSVCNSHTAVLIRVNAALWFDRQEHC